LCHSAFSAHDHDNIREAATAIIDSSMNTLRKAWAPPRALRERHTPMTTTPPDPPQPSQKVMQAASSNDLGGFKRILVRRKEKGLLSKPKVTSLLYDFEQGIIYEETDEVLRVYPWSKVASVYVSSTSTFINKRYISSRYSATLVPADGEKLVLRGLYMDPAIVYDKKGLSADHHQTYLLMAAGAAIVSEAQLPGALARLQRGEELAFGEVKISLAGVHIDKGVIPWNTVKDVQVADGYAQITQAGRFLPLSRQPVGRYRTFPSSPCWPAPFTPASGPSGRKT